MLDDVLEYVLLAFLPLVPLQRDRDHLLKLCLRLRLCVLAGEAAQVDGESISDIARDLSRIGIVTYEGPLTPLTPRRTADWPGRDGRYGITDQDQRHVSFRNRVSRPELPSLDTWPKRMPLGCLLVSVSNLAEHCLAQMVPNELE